MKKLVEHIKHKNDLRNYSISLFIIMMVINFLGANENNNIANTILLGLISYFSTYCYIQLLDYPVKALLSIILAQTITFINDLITTQDINHAIYVIGAQGILVVIAVIFHIWFINGKLKSEKEKYKLREKVWMILNFHREPIKLPVWIYIITYSIIITTIANFSRTPGLDEILNSSTSQIYGALVVLLPTFKILSLISTTRLAYWIYLIYVALEIHAFRITAEDWTVATLLKLLIDMIIVVITIEKLISKDIEIREQRKKKPETA